MTLVAPDPPVRVELLPGGAPPDRARLRGAMTATHEFAMGSTPEVATRMKALYEETFAALLADSVVIPGFGTAQELLLERIAWLWTWQKCNDNDPEGASPGRYEKVTTAYLGAMRTLFKVRETADANDAFKRAFAHQVLTAVTDAVNETVMELDPELGQVLLQAVLAKLRAAMAA